MITFEEISKKYDGKSLFSIEAAAKTYSKKADYNRKEFILSLYYLERTNRYKENPIYRDDTFKRYINDLFNLSYSTFQKERFAYITVPLATEHHGVGIIDKIRTECGINKIKEVIKEIDDKDIKKSVEIDKIIKKHAKPKTVKPKTPPKKATVSTTSSTPIDIPRQKDPATTTSTPIDIPKQKETADRILKLLKTVKDQQETIMLQKMEIKRLEDENRELKQRMQTAHNFINPINIGINQKPAHM